MFKKIIALVCVAIATACFVGGAEKSKDTPLGFSEAELIGTVKEVKLVNGGHKLSFISVKLDGKQVPSHFFTDEEVKVGDRVVIYLIVRIGTGVSWVKVRPFTQ